MRLDVSIVDFERIVRFRAVVVCQLQASALQNRANIYYISADIVKADINIVIQKLAITLIVKHKHKHKHRQRQIYITTLVRGGVGRDNKKFKSICLTPVINKQLTSMDHRYSSAAGVPGAGRAAPSGKVPRKYKLNFHCGKSYLQSYSRPGQVEMQLLLL
jgi:hypothetical protein